MAHIRNVKLILDEYWYRDLFAAGDGERSNAWDLIVSLETTVKGFPKPDSTVEDATTKVINALSDFKTTCEQRQEIRKRVEEHFDDA